MGCFLRREWNVMKEIEGEENATLSESAILIKSHLSLSVLKLFGLPDLE